MTYQEIIDYVESEYSRSLNIKDKREAIQIRYRAKVVFDKRFPNPTYCPSCGQKILKGNFNVS